MSRKIVGLVMVALLSFVVVGCDDDNGDGKPEFNPTCQKHPELCE